MSKHCGIEDSATGTLVGFQVLFSSQREFLMHVPDGLLSTEVCIAAGVISLGAFGYSLRRLKDSLAERTVPMTGMMAALIFAGQMINFPIALLGIPSVSGHLMGGVLAAVVLGPWAGCIAVTLVLIVQCLLFADGGLLALGVNVLNMAVVGSLGGYAVFAFVRQRLGNGARGTLAGGIIAAWLSVIAASALFSLQFGLSHAGGELFDVRRLFALMVSIHSAIGVGEAFITGSVIGFVLAQRPDLLYSADADGAGGVVPRAGRAVAFGVMCALAVAAFVAPFASSFPDGLVEISERMQFSKLEQSRVLLFADYDQVLPGWQKLSVSLSGIIGALAVLMIVFLLDRSLRLRQRAAAADVPHE
ncbi:MAG: energy-coupling factor ABC transporter permease [Planctomycetaceae bacterium]|nr:energy-coupling factor ABC transporter permease [Planctomycetaceae bacterium]